MLPHRPAHQQVMRPVRSITLLAKRGGELGPVPRAMHERVGDHLASSGALLAHAERHELDHRVEPGAGHLRDGALKRRAQSI